MALIREERDAGFWREIADHPAVKPHVALGRSVDVAALVAHPRVRPLASANGGFLFVQLDGLGRVHELHTLYRPEGWGKEVLGAAIAAFDLIFQTGQLVVTFEVEGHWRSRPPRTFRFAPCGDFEPTEFGRRFKTWALSKADWDTSPARSRMTA